MTGKNKSYTRELKLHAVNMYLEQGLSSSVIVRELGIKNETQVRRWVKLFSEKGESAFDLETRGRGRGGTRGRPKNNFKSIEEELEYLRMENAYLKKLRALKRR